MKHLAIVFITLLTQNTFKGAHTQDIVCNSCVDCRSCPLGIDINYCGKMECLKGPDETCGGIFDIMGKCAPGLWCDNCGQCSGCTIQEPRVCSNTDKPKLCHVGLT